MATVSSSACNRPAAPVETDSPIPPSHTPSDHAKKQLLLDIVSQTPADVAASIGPNEPETGTVGTQSPTGVESITGLGFSRRQRQWIVRPDGLIDRLRLCSLPDGPLIRRGTDHPSTDRTTTVRPNNAKTGSVRTQTSRLKITWSSRNIHRHGLGPLGAHTETGSASDRPSDHLDRPGTAFLCAIEDRLYRPSNQMMQTMQTC